jgi:hypothetical protein
MLLKVSGVACLAPCRNHLVLIHRQGAGQQWDAGLPILRRLAACGS